MSSANPIASPLQAGRRSHARRRIDGLTYVEFGPDNGAILIDVGEGGLGFQSVMPVSMNQALLFKFKLPGSAAYLEGFGEVAWMNESGKGGGLRFVDVDEPVSSQIREWTGMLSAPESIAVTNGNDAEAELAPEVPAETALSPDQIDAAEPAATPAAPVAEGSAETELLATIISDASAAAENAELPSTDTSEIPSVSPEEIPDVSPEVQSAAPADQSDATQAGATQAPAHVSAAPVASPIPEFTIEVTPDSIGPLTAPIGPARINVLPQSAHSADQGASGLPSNKESEPIVAQLAMSPKPAPAPAPYSKLDSNLDSRNLVSVKKPRQKPVTSKPAAIPTVSPSGQHSAAENSFIRQPQKPALAGTEWENFITTQAANSEPRPPLSQAIRVGIGAAAGACLVLALVLGVPYLKTQVQATANARLASSNLGNPSTFEVEVADINNRRWILRSGGDAGSPFGDASSKREQSAASAAARKSSRSDDSDNAVETPVATPQTKFAKPGELALSRPHATNIGGTSAQLTAPSIFDGITPPIGSVADRLVTGGPDAPGIVPPESESAVKKSTLQAAVLVQRISPVYPSNALQSQVQGEVLVNATIGKDGIPKNLKVIRGDQRLTSAALAAIGQWRYRPATLAGDPIETQIEITIDFHLK
jgi:TonB family protein